MTPSILGGAQEANGNLVTKVELPGKQGQVIYFH